MGGYKRLSNVAFFADGYDILISLGDLYDVTLQKAIDHYAPEHVIAVRGNHCVDQSFPAPTIDLHLQTIERFGLTFGGFAGSWQYKKVGNHIYTQDEVHQLLQNFPAADVFIAHNSPRGIHERDTGIHKGFDAFIEYIDRTQPAYFLHVGPEYAAWSSTLQRSFLSRKYLYHGGLWREQLHLGFIMNKLLLILLLLIPLSTIAGGKPCSGKKGGISHCEGSQFVCNDGSSSKSTKDCSSYISGNTTQKAAPVAVIPTVTEATNSPIAQDNSAISKVSDSILKLDYSGFTVWLDCSKRAPIKFQYVAQRDTGSFKRYDKFSLDPKVPKECQQYSSKAYGIKYYWRSYCQNLNNIHFNENLICYD